MRTTNMNARECKWLKGRKRKKKKISKESRRNEEASEKRNDRKIVHGWKRVKGIIDSCVRVHLVKMRQHERTRGRVLGAEWNGRYLKQCTDLWSPARCVYIHPPLKRKKEKKKMKSSALPTPFLPLRPLLQPPAAPSHSSYEPRAGRSEYNFLYCVNVRTIRLNKKKNVYITKLWRFESLRSLTHPRVVLRATSPSTTL